MDVALDLAFLGHLPFSGQRLRPSLAAAPSSSEMRWSYSQFPEAWWQPQAQMLAGFSRLVTLVAGRTLSEHPGRQIVLRIVASVTVAFNTPDVQCGSGVLHR
jgi:hypothetical protein